MATTSDKVAAVRKATSEEQVPGPGAYTLDMLTIAGNQHPKSGVRPVTVPKISLEGAFPQPGPGQYAAPSSFFTRGGNIQFGASHRDHTMLAVNLNKSTGLSPGPAGYDNSFRSGIQTTRIPSGRWSNCSRNSTMNAIHTKYEMGSSPGPAAGYVVAGNLSTAVSMGYNKFAKARKLYDPNPEEVPGPGQYDILKITTMGAARAKGRNYWGLDTKNKVTRPPQGDVPGPGQYSQSLEKRGGNTTRFAKSERFRPIFGYT